MNECPIKLVGPVPFCHCRLAVSMLLCALVLWGSAGLSSAQQALSQTAIQKLIDGLNDPANDEKSRQEIRDTLRRQDFKIVRGILKKELVKAERRLAAIDLYAAFGRGESAEDIVQYLQGDDPELSKATLKALGRMGKISAEPAIQKVLDGLNACAPTADTRQMFFDVLVAQDFARLRPILKKELLKAERRLAAIDLYAAFGRGESAEDIVQYLQGDDPELSKATLKALGRMGKISAEPAIQKVLDGLNACAPTADARQMFFDVLVAQDFARLRPILKKELQNDNRRLVAIELYSGFAWEEGADDIVQFLKAEDENLRKATIRALANMGGEKAAEGLLNEFKSKKADDPLYSEYLDSFEQIPFSVKVIEHFLSVLGSEESRSRAVSILDKQMCRAFVDNASAATVIPDYWQANKTKLQLYCSTFKDVPGWQPLFSNKDTQNIKKFGRNLYFAVGMHAEVQLADKLDSSADWEAVIYVLLIDFNEKKGQNGSWIAEYWTNPATQKKECEASLRVLKNGFRTSADDKSFTKADNTQKWAEVKIQRKADKLYHFVNGTQVGLVPYGLPGPVHSIMVASDENGLLIGGARIRALK